MNSADYQQMVERIVDALFSGGFIVPTATRAGVRWAIQDAIREER